ncbi:MAG TPA: S8 family serine peptidase [Flavobacteriales bacterium]|nr:S8 family serine peptidase [Flavobacteriales bacterium]
MKGSFLLIVAFLIARITFAQETEHVPGDILIMLRPGASVSAVVDELRQVEGDPTGLRVVREVSAPMRAWLLRFDAEAVPQHVMLRAVRAHRAIQMAQNNHVIKERAIPNDPQFADQWQHVNINSAAAWDISTGGVTAAGDTIVVAIIERADLSHEDLAGNAWINHDEIAGNGVDDDSNGYIDDVRGWNTPNGDDQVYATNHSTQVAGMIGAVGNNCIGLTGANWRVKMMPVNDGGFQEDQVVAA